MPMSEDRVVHIWQTDSGIAATLGGQPGESISFSYLVDGQFNDVAINADNNGCATFTVISAVSDCFDMIFLCNLNLIYGAFSFKNDKV